MNYLLIPTNISFVYISYNCINRLKYGLDITIYANPEFTWEQMKQIRFGLEDNLDVSPYLNPGIDYEEMERIREELERNK